jgi:hypothetical protein
LIGICRLITTSSGMAAGIATLIKARFPTGMLRIRSTAWYIEM